MNRKQRRIEQSQNKDAVTISFRGTSYPIEQFIALAVKEHNAGNIHVAIECYNLILTQTPDNAEVHNNRGMALQAMGHFAEALQDYDKAIAINNHYADAHNNRGLILNNLLRYDDALVSFDKAIAANPHFAYAYNNRGLALQKLQRDADALANYDKAIAINPNFAYAYNNRSLILKAMKRYDEALLGYQKAIALGPDIPYVTGELLNTQMHICKWEGIDQLNEKLKKGIEAGSPVTLPFMILASPLSPAYQRKCAEIYVKNTFPPQTTKLWNCERYTHAKIRVAYVSADFSEHAVSLLMAGVFEQHDKTRFEIYGISLAPEAHDVIGKQIKTACDRFIDVAQKSDREVAQLLRDLEIDIAVDLTGFTQGGRTNIFAWRPAPAQINYIGYPATMGADYIDYIIADAFVIPPRSQSQYTEKVVYLPDCFQANGDKQFIPGGKPNRGKYRLPEQGFVFCSFNNSYKINPPFFDIWMRLLQSVPGSVQWLLGDEHVQHNLRLEASNRGVDPSRLIFAARVPYEEHLARLANAGLFLDTSPFNGGATASDALWAGVPLITCPGEAFSSRMAGSLLTAIGLSELIANSLSEYEKLALTLATAPERLSGIKAKLAQNRTKSPLFDTTRFTKTLEAAYTKIVERSQNGLSPDHIYVTTELS